MPTHFLDVVPAPALYLVLLVLFVAIVELGYKLGDKRQRDTDFIDEGRSNQAGVVLGAMLTMSSLLLGFTFSMAGGQFDSRRLLVIDDVNAIGTAFLRTQHLPEPQRAASRALFGRYVDGRDALFNANPPSEVQGPVALQDALWAEAAVLARGAPTPVLSLYQVHRPDVTVAWIESYAPV